MKEAFVFKRGGRMGPGEERQEVRGDKRKEGGRKAVRLVQWRGSGTGGGGPEGVLRTRCSLTDQLVCV